MVSIVIFLSENSFVLALKPVTSWRRVYEKISVPMRVVPNFAVSRGFGSINRELMGQLVCCNLPVELLNVICCYSEKQYENVNLKQDERDFWRLMNHGCPGG